MPSARVPQRLAVVFRVSAAALLIAANLWLDRSVFVPVRDGDERLGYLFVSASFAEFAVLLLAALAAIVGLQLLATRHEPATGRWTIDNTRHLRVYGWLVVSLLPLVNLAAPIAGAIAPWSYVAFDLRWWWWPVVAGASLAALFDVRSWRTERAQSILPIAVALVPMLFAWASTPWPPNARLHGDEPKYIRFCENLYQGLGFDISAKRPLTDPDAKPHLLTGLASLIVESGREIPNIANDLRRLAGFDAPPRLVSGPPSTDMFFAGKHPGTVYQLHTPGLSLILLPAYAVDRLVTGKGIGYNNEFPAEMPAVNLTLLCLVGALAFTTFTLLRRAGIDGMTSAVASVVACCVLPAGPFAFQIYPETAAGLIVALAADRMLRRDTPSARADMALGIAIGFVPLLHVRFSLVVAAASLWLAWEGRRQWRSLVPFATGVAVSLGGVAFYLYHLTGNPLPFANYGAVPLTLDNLTLGVPGFLFDKRFGVLPHSPVFFACALGLGAMWRRDRRLALLCAVLVIAIVIPAAGYSYWAGGGTPGRYVVALAPMLALALAHGVRVLKTFRFGIAVFAALTLVSLETAANYNFFYQKEIGSLLAPGFSGWRPNMLFPDVGQSWNLAPSDMRLLGAWTAVIVAIAVLGWLASRSLSSSAPPITRRFVAAALATLAVIAATGTMINRMTGRNTESAFLLSRPEVRWRALTKFADDRHCTICYSSSRGEMNPADALGNEPGLVDMRVESPARLNETIRFRIRPRTITGEDLLATFAVDFGDGTTAQFDRHYGDLRVNHTFDRPGEYRIRVLAAWAARQVSTELVVKIS